MGGAGVNTHTVCAVSDAHDTPAQAARRCVASDVTFKASCTLPKNDVGLRCLHLHGRARQRRPPGAPDPRGGGGHPGGREPLRRCVPCLPWPAVVVPHSCAAASALPTQPPLWAARQRADAPPGARRVDCRRSAPGRGPGGCGLWLSWLRHLTRSWPRRGAGEDRGTHRRLRVLLPKELPRRRERARRAGEGRSASTRGSRAVPPSRRVPVPLAPCFAPRRLAGGLV